MSAEAGSSWAPPPPPPISGVARPILSHATLGGFKPSDLLDTPPGADATEKRWKHEEDEEEMYTRAAAAIERGWEDKKKEEMYTKSPAGAAKELGGQKDARAWEEQSAEEAMMDSILHEVEQGGLAEEDSDGEESVRTEVLPDEAVLRQRQARSDTHDWELQDVQMEQEACAMLSPKLAEADSLDESAATELIVAKKQGNLVYRERGKLAKALESFREKKLHEAVAAAVESSSETEGEGSLPSRGSSEGSFEAWGRKMRQTDAAVVEASSQSENEDEGSLPSRGSSEGSF